MTIQNIPKTKIAFRSALTYFCFLLVLNPFIIMYLRIQLPVVVSFRCTCTHAQNTTVMQPLSPYLQDSCQFDAIFK